ncbi:MAG: lytic murein transglycosylase [Pseudomonadota bacterium]
MTQAKHSDGRPDDADQVEAAEEGEGRVTAHAPDMPALKVSRADPAKRQILRMRGGAAWWPAALVALFVMSVVYPAGVTSWVSDADLDELGVRDTRTAAQAPKVQKPSDNAAATRGAPITTGALGPRRASLSPSPSVAPMPPQPPPTSPPSKPAGDAATPTPMPTTGAPAPEDFASFIASLRHDATNQGVSAVVFKDASRALREDDQVVAQTKRQPEFSRTAGDYVSRLVSSARVARGRRLLRTHAALLKRISDRYQVPAEVIVAIWGIESSYGDSFGGRNVVRSLASLAYRDQRRAAFWRRELVAALQIIEDGDVPVDGLKGSWAGAMGHTQFMPTTYRAYAVDFDGDGKRDIWGSIGDALASTANYLRASGWRKGLPWGVEVRLPEGFDYALAAPEEARDLKAWRGLGVATMVDPKSKRREARRKNSARKPATRADTRLKGTLQLYLPAGANGPAFLLSDNFKVILEYNRAHLYALSVGHLADRMRGGKRFVQRWPKNDTALAFNERAELQRLLSARGWNTGGIDGILGGRSRDAIRRFQKEQGLPADGHPTPGLLKRLRKTVAAVEKS